MHHTHLEIPKCPNFYIMKFYCRGKYKSSDLVNIDQAAHEPLQNAAKGLGKNK